MLSNALTNWVDWIGKPFAATTVVAVLGVDLGDVNPNVFQILGFLSFWLVLLMSLVEDD